MNQLTRIAVDTSKHVFTLHGVDESGRPALRRNLRRAAFLEFFARLPPALVALEACGGRTTGGASCRRSDMRWR